MSVQLISWNLPHREKCNSYGWLLLQASDASSPLRFEEKWQRCWLLIDETSPLKNYLLKTSFRRHIFIYLFEFFARFRLSSVFGNLYFCICSDFLLSHHPMQIGPQPKVLPTSNQPITPQCWHRHMSGRWWWWGGERLHKDFPLSKTHRLPKDSILHQQHLQISFSSQLHKTNSSSCTSLKLASENEREVGFLHSVPGLVLHWRRLPGWARGQTGFRWNRIPGRERGVFGLVVRLDGNRW